LKIQQDVARFQQAPVVVVRLMLLITLNRDVCEEFVQQSAKSSQFRFDL